MEASINLIVFVVTGAYTVELMTAVIVICLQLVMRVTGTTSIDPYGSDAGSVKNETMGNSALCSIECFDTVDLGTRWPVKFLATKNTDADLH